MSQTLSCATHQTYGVQRVCRVWEQARSTVYATLKVAPPPLPQRRGPKPNVSDEALLDLIVDALAQSSFLGEGHRKVWAHLRWVREVTVSRRRVLRLMREHHLLSPRRARSEVRRHDGEIITAAPNLMWGTDGAKIWTYEEGWVWVFVAVEHWNAECVGWHVTKRGDRLAALEPVKQGLERIFGSAGADVALGLRLRMDHGTQYTSDHFVNQVRFWGIAPSFAFVAQPETNGVAERFNRTLKEQAIYGRSFRNAEEVRAAVAAFIDRYNAEWRVEKNGYRSPNEARANWLAANIVKAA